MSVSRSFQTSLIAVCCLALALGTAVRAADENDDVAGGDAPRAQSRRPTTRPHDAQKDDEDNADAKTGKPKTVRLPAPVDAVTPAGGGRYLLLRINKLNKLAVYDVSLDKITGYISLPSNDMLVAGGAEKIVLVARDKGVVQRWSIEPLKKELTVALEVRGTVDGVVMGHASSGPVLVMTREGQRFLALSTLKALEFSGGGEGRIGDWRPHPQYPIHVAASADGQTFAGWTLGLSPQGVRILQIQGNRLVGRYEHESAGILLPSWDGSMLFTSSGVYSADLKRLNEQQLRGVNCIPAYQPSYFVGVGGGDNDRGDRGDGRGGAKLSIYTSGDRALLVTLDDLTELGPSGDRFGGSSGLPMNQRVFLVPQHGRLVIVNPTRDALVARPFDIVRALDKAGIDYLFVESLPQTTAAPGKRYRYPIKVKSKAGNVKFSLESGPEGMTISPQGELAWDVPAEQEAGQTGVIVTIEDASGQSVFHTFNLQTESTRPPAERDKPTEPKAGEREKSDV